MNFGIGGPWDNRFVGGGYGHYFCGDYFAPFYYRNGFRPGHAHGARHYDPLFAYNHWNNRNNPGWYNGLHNNYWNRVNNPGLRPPTTVAQTRALGARGGLAAGAIVPRPAGAPAGPARGNRMQMAAARQLQRPATLRAESERTATKAVSTSPRPAGGPTML